MVERKTMETMVAMQFVLKIKYQKLEKSLDESKGSTKSNKTMKENQKG
jgi:hypothetical protein